MELWKGSMARVPEPTRLPGWRIFRTLQSARSFLGIVHAVDEMVAIQKAIKEFRITDPEQQKRLVAERREPNP